MLNKNSRCRENDNFNFKIFYLYIFVFLFTIIILCQDGQGTDNTLGGTISGAPIRSSGVDSTLGGTISGAPIRSSGVDSTLGGTLTDTSQPTRTDSSRSFYVGSQGPVQVEKYIKGLTEKYYKNENITIRLKVLNSNPRNKLEDVYIIEEIPHELELINVKPGNYIRIESATAQTIKWNFKNNLSNIQNLEYTVKTNKSGAYLIGTTVLNAKIKDQTGKNYEIIQSSGNINIITIYNRDPKLVGGGGLDSIRNFKVGEDLNIGLSVLDPDYDSLTAYLYKEDGSILDKSDINSTYCLDKYLGENCTTLTLLLNTSIYNNNLGLHRFTIEVTDNESIDTAEYEIDIHNWWKHRWSPSVDTTYTILFSLGTGVGIGITKLWEKRKKKKKKTRINWAIKQ